MNHFTINHLQHFVFIKNFIFVLMQKNTIRYWICQVLGWGSWTIINLFFVYLFAQDYYFNDTEKRRLFLMGLFIQFVWYILATHLLRFGLKKANWIQFSINKVIGLFVAGVFITGMVSYYGARITAKSTGNSLIQYEKNEDFHDAVQKEKEKGVSNTSYYLAKANNSKDSINYSIVQRIKKATGWYRNEKGVWQYEDQRKGRFWWDMIFNFILIALWLLIYMVWHYLERNRKDELDKLNLEKIVKEMELKTIKSHINPHFIFNSLNSIRALVDENPARARSAITQLSNILRSSLKVGKMETMPLEAELLIVKDYLALEQMRFEERLRIQMDIDPKTLHQHVPPMMLQTLAENAIKHGIGKQMDGGMVRIISKITDQKFILIVQNTGTLGTNTTEGFGFKSTRDRLKILFGNGANLQVKQIEKLLVEAKIEMPVRE